MTLRVHIASELVIELPDDTTDAEAHALAAEVTVRWGHIPRRVARTATAPHITASARLRYPNTEGVPA